MLKGNTKSIMGENIREAKNKGLSEKDAVMASMKKAKKVVPAGNPFAKMKAC